MVAKEEECLLLVVRIDPWVVLHINCFEEQNNCFCTTKPPQPSTTCSTVAANNGSLERLMEAIVAILHCLSLEQLEHRKGREGSRIICLAQQDQNDSLS